MFDKTKPPSIDRNRGFFVATMLAILTVGILGAVPEGRH